LTGGQDLQERQEDFDRTEAEKEREIFLDRINRIFKIKGIDRRGRRIIETGLIE
jgi:hypothetical protein